MSVRTRILIAGVGLGVAVASLSLQWGHTAPREIRVGLVRSSPMGGGTPDNKPSGLIVSLVEEAARRRSIRLRWVQSAETSEELLLGGKIDVWPALAHTPERDSRLHITQPYLRNDFCLVSRPEYGIRTPGECVNHKVAIVDGAVTRMLSARHLPRAALRPAGSRAGALQALCRGEAEATFIEMAFVQTALLSRPEGCETTRLQVTPLPGAAIELGLATSRANSALGEQLRAEIEKMRRDGTFAHLLAYWNPFSVSENLILLQEQEQWLRTWLLAGGLTAAMLLAALLFWQNRRVSRARNLAEGANAAYEESLTELLAAREALRERALRDGLTGLYNRGAFLEMLGMELSRAGREDGKVALILADLDHFKRINDTLGHLAGDAALAEAARRMSDAVRPYDAIARYGGEELAILLPGCGPAEAAKRAEDVRQALAGRPCAAGGHAIAITCSLGVTASRGFAASAEQLLESADRAMYFAKAAGRNCVAVATAAGQPELYPNVSHHQ